ncbi:MAG: hypothetical protein ACP5C3_04045 [Methanomicrobiales archaeon]
MDTMILGIICGLAFGIFAVLIMLPMGFDTKREKWEATSGAFVERFMIGFLIPNVAIGLSPVLTGIILGFALSLPSAIITRAYAPILILGIIGGMVIGFATQMVIG